MRKTVKNSIFYGQKRKILGKIFLFLGGQRWIRTLDHLTLGVNNLVLGLFWAVFHEFSEEMMFIFWVQIGGRGSIFHFFTF